MHQQVTSEIKRVQITSNSQSAVILKACRRANAKGAWNQMGKEQDEIKWRRNKSDRFSWRKKM